MSKKTILMRMARDGTLSRVAVNSEQPVQADPRTAMKDANILAAALTDPVLGNAAARCVRNKSMGRS
jgi:hypothetical protein